MHGPLEILLADGVIEETCRRLKSGKEVDLFRWGTLQVSAYERASAP